MLFAERLLAGFVVGDPLAVADPAFETPFGRERAVGPEDIPRAVGLAVVIERLAVDLPVVEIVRPFAVLPAPLILAFDERLSIGVEFAVNAVRLDVIVGEIGHLALDADRSVRVFFRRNHFAADDRRLGDNFGLVQVNGGTVVRFN